MFRLKFYGKLSSFSYFHVPQFNNFISKNMFAMFQEFDNSAESLVSNLFVNNTEDDDLDVGECSVSSFLK